MGSVVFSSRNPNRVHPAWLNKVTTTTVEQEQFSKQVMQMDKLHARFISMERMIRDLKSHYHQGLIRPADYELEMKQLLDQMNQLQQELQGKKTK